jgi:hypothetical protein
MRRSHLILSILAPLAMAACTPTMPNSAAGVGFQDYGTYQAQRDAALNGGAAIPPTTTPPSGFSPERIGAAIDAASGTSLAPGASLDASGAVIGADSSGIPPTPPTPVAPVPYGATPVAPVAPVDPASLPTRAGSGPNLVQYALTTNNAVGQPTYERSSLQLRDPAKVCQGYSSADQAQSAFLDSGGPEKDRKGLDPDGDGFACGWDPTPFRNAVR